MMSLEELIANKYISVVKHPQVDLYIYNYTQKTQYESMWNEITKTHRGMIKDKHGQIVSRPLPKFLNVGQDESATFPVGKNFQVFDKLDGSLGITYWIDNKVYLATRGSFSSDQAIKGTQLLQANPDLMQALDPAYTYCFEIIYPENRVVVNYGIQEKLVLLAIIHTRSGQELDILKSDLPVEKATVFDGLLDFDQIVAIQNTSSEGFVIKFEDGFRLKFKFEEYKRLHRILTNVTSRTIWNI